MKGCLTLRAPSSYEERGIVFDDGNNGHPLTRRMEIVENLHEGLPVNCQSSCGQRLPAATRDRSSYYTHHPSLHITPLCSSISTA